MIVPPPVLNPLRSKTLDFSVVIESNAAKVEAVSDNSQRLFILVRDIDEWQVSISRTKR